MLRVWCVLVGRDLGFSHQFTMPHSANLLYRYIYIRPEWPLLMFFSERLPPELNVT